MATTMPVMVNLCDCSTNGLKFWSPCVPQIGSNCIQTYKCQNGNYPLSDISYGCSSFDNVAIERRIQNQSRMFETQYRDAKKSVNVASDILSFKGSKQDFEGLSSRVWSNPNYLRNQSDRSTPSRSGSFTQSGVRNQPFGMKFGIPGYVNVPTRGNSTRSTITADRPGAMTPGGQGVDVKHGSYDRYLAKKKGILLTKPSVNAGTAPATLIPIRQNPTSENKINNSAGMNNMVYKFSLVNTSGAEGQGCIDCSFSNLNVQPFPVI